MEVGDQAIDAVELDTRVEKNRGIAAAGLDLAIFCGGGFQRAAAGGANGDHAVPSGLGFPDALSSLLADGIPLTVHLVIRDLVLLHGAEGSQTHMQGNLSNADTLGTDGIHQLRGEVQACRGCGSAAQLLGIDRLILALIFQLLGDVGRQRHLAKFIQFFIKGLGVIIECNKLVAILQRFVHHSGQGAVTKTNLGAGLHPLAGLCQTLPLISLDLPQKQQLTHSTGGLFDTHDAGGQHLGVVDHQQVTRLKIFRQIAENPVLDAVVLLAQNHEPSRVSGVCRLLCNEFFG